VRRRSAVTHKSGRTRKVLSLAFSCVWTGMFKASAARWTGLAALQFAPVAPSRLVRDDQDDFKGRDGF
jgi:hypothetical protein